MEQSNNNKSKKKKNKKKKKKKKLVDLSSLILNSLNKTWIGYTNVTFFSQNSQLTFKDVRKKIHL
jgi:cytoskeletal protein RodZ